MRTAVTVLEDLGQQVLSSANALLWAPPCHRLVGGEQSGVRDSPQGTILLQHQEALVVQLIMAPVPRRDQESQTQD